jgi:hypothetical protein
MYIIHVHHENEDDDICVTCALNEHDDEFMIEYFVLCAPHKVLSHGTIMLRSGSYDDDDG